MRLLVNGAEHDSQAASLTDLWREVAPTLGLADSQGVALALNHALVRREHWPEATLAEGDSIEIIRAVQGG